MCQSDLDERKALEAAAKKAGFRLEPSECDFLALIEHSKPLTTKALMSGKPVMFGKFAVGGKVAYHTVSFTERDGEDWAQVKDKSGKVISEHRAQILVPRLPAAPLPKIFGGRKCWLEVRTRYGCLQVQGRCGGWGFAWSSCG
jgi:YD repeat-containing protein